MSERETATEAHADAATLNTTTPRGRDGVRAAQREYGAILAAAVVADIRPHAPELCDSHENLREENAALTACLAAVEQERDAMRMVLEAAELFVTASFAARPWPEYARARRALNVACEQARMAQAALADTPPVSPGDAVQEAGKDA